MAEPDALPCVLCLAQPDLREVKVGLYPDLHARILPHLKTKTAFNSTIRAVYYKTLQIPCVVDLSVIRVNVVEPRIVKECQMPPKV